MCPTVKARPQEIIIPDLATIKEEDPVEVYRYIWRRPNGQYSLVKLINGKKIHFGTFKTKAEALFEKYLLMAVDWDLETLCTLESTIPPFEDEELPEFPTNPTDRYRPGGRLFGFRGVHLITREKSRKNRNPWSRVWVSQIRYKRPKYLGVFEDPLSAELVYKLVKKELEIEKQRIKDDKRIKNDSGRHDC